MDQSNAIESAATLPRTKNGRLAACEPCQKRKYACDRSLPTCQRCQRSRLKKPCRYVAQNGQSEQISAYLSNNTTIDFPSSLQNDLTVKTSRLININESVELARNSWDSDLDEACEAIHGGETKSPMLISQDNHVNVLFDTTTNDLGIALDVLASLPKPEAEYILAKPHINPFDGWVPLSTSNILIELRTTFAYAFRQSRDTEHLTNLALVMFSNTAQDISNSQENDSRDWYTSFSGSRIRWEVIGLLFSSWALGVLQNKEDIDQYRPRVLASKFFEMMKNCITLCRAAKANNILLLYLLYRTSIVSSILHGLNNHDFWVFHAETVSLACSMGLDAMSDSSIEDHRISKQSERRLFTAIYVLDIAAAALSGKLPLLASRRCSTALPLDICNTTLFNWSTDQTSDACSLGVDDNGWNTDGKIYSTTSLRARGLIARIREEILNIALDQRQVDVHDLIKLKSKQIFTFSQLPNCIRFVNGEENLKNLEPHVLYTKLFIRLEHLQNVFLVERMLHKVQSNVTRDNLIEISLEIISVTVTFWTRNDCLVGMEGDHEWFIMGYAIPAAVVLCEMLLQMQTKGYGFSTPVSAIIRQLSLLRAFLEWLILRVPCTDRCSRTRNLIVKVLDQFLSHAPDTTNGVPVSSGFQQSSVETVFLNDLRDIDVFNWVA